MANFDIDHLDYITTHLTMASDGIGHCKNNLKYPGRREYREHPLYLDAMEKVKVAEAAIGKILGHFQDLETEARNSLPPKEEEEIIYDNPFEDDDDDDDDDF